jgi:hypothetical protein
LDGVKTRKEIKKLLFGWCKYRKKNKKNYYLDGVKTGKETKNYYLDGVKTGK